MGIFKGKLDINKAVDTATSAVDKLFFTDEEKTVHFIKMADKTVDFYGKTLEENSVRSRTRRGVVYIVLFLVAALVVVSVVRIIMNEPIDQIIILAQTFNIPVAFITVLAFFFGGYYMKNIKLRSDRKKES